MSQLLPHSPDAPVAVGEGLPLTAADFLADAGRIADALADRDRGEVVLSCGDPYLFGIALVGAWYAGHVAVLPPNSQPGTLAALAAGSEVRAFLHDRDEDSVGMHVGRMRDRPISTRAWSLPPIDAHAATLTTSGSTGGHERCPKTTAQLLGEADLLARLFSVTSSARVISSVPPYHVYGLLFGVLLPLRAGGLFVRETPLHAESVGHSLARHRATHLISVPAHLAALAAADSLPSVERVFSSGAPLPAATAEALRSRHGWRVTEVFGSTETGGIAWREWPDETWRPFPDSSVAVGADEQLMLDSPRLWPAAPRPLPCADRVALLPDGRFELLGRLDGVVKVGGKRVSVREIEERIRALSGVRDVAALAVHGAGPRGDEIWVAVVAPDWTQDRLREALLTWLDPVTLPRRIRLVETLPREATGKLVHERLRDLFDAPSEAGSVFDLVPDVERALPDSDGEEGRVLELTVPANLAYFRGHFDGHPILPAVVQLDGIILRQAERIWPALGTLRRVLRLKFKRPIGPGARLSVRLQYKAAESRVAFEILEGAVSCASGTLLFGGPS